MLCRRGFLYHFRRHCLHYTRFTRISEQLRLATARFANTRSYSSLKPDQCSSDKHSTLSSFLAYSSRVGLSSQSTTYVGTHYEYTAQNALTRLGFSLIRSGGRFDQGIDLFGEWRLPVQARQTPFKVLVQCKALARKPMPSLVRELEGIFVGAPAGWREGHNRMNSNSQSKDDLYDERGMGMDVLALLVTPKESTKGVRDALGRSRWPLGFVKMTLDGTVEQLLWNKNASNRGLDGIGITLMNKTISQSNDESQNIQREVQLTWMGRLLAQEDFR